MRLVDLDPKWLIYDGERVGFTFVSPTNNQYRQSCFSVAFDTHIQLDMFEEQLGEDVNVQPCNEMAFWTITGDSFDNLSVTPSINGAYGGLWHGFITDGKIVGGLSH
jgi:hypothetical protein